MQNNQPCFSWRSDNFLFLRKMTSFLVSNEFVSNFSLQNQYCQNGSQPMRFQYSLIVNVLLITDI